MPEAIPAQTIQTVARSIFKEASSYGFGPLDIVRLINELMDLCMGNSEAEADTSPSNAEALSDFGDQPLQLPLHGKHVKIRAFSPDKDLDLLEKWLPDKYGRYFVLSCATAQTVTV